MELVSIINTDVINSKNDAFWNDIRSEIKAVAPKPVLVVCNCPADSAENQQLQKMLDACKLQPEQYNIIRLAAGEQIAWFRLREHFAPKAVFLIGITPLQLGVSASFILHAPNNFNDTIWLPTLNISELEQHAALKKQLWQNGMKPLFIDSGMLNN